MEEAQKALTLADEAHEVAETAARKTDRLEDAAQSAWHAIPLYGQPGYDEAVRTAVRAAYDAAQVANDAAQHLARRLNNEAIDAARLVHSLRHESRG